MPFRVSVEGVEELEAVHFRHHQVEDHDIGRRFANPVERVHAFPRLLEHELVDVSRIDPRAVVEIVLGEEDIPDIPLDLGINLERDERDEVDETVR